MIVAMYEERCLHSDVCKYGKNRTNGMYCTGERCLHFIDRTKLADGVKTNADLIRAMSDEELAKWLCGISTAECCDRSCPARDMCDLGDNGLIKWLKQPADMRGEKDG